MNVTTVAAAGVAVRVREWGAADGRPLLFWPGLDPWGALQLVEAGPLLAEGGIRALAIEPPGTTATPPLAEPGDYLPTRLAQLVVGVAEALGVGRFAYMGASWGASIGVHLAARHAERVEALVLLDAGHTDVTLDVTLRELERQLEADQAEFSFASWDAFLDRVPASRPKLELRYREGMVERDGRIVPRSSARAAAWALYGVAAEPPSSAHERLGELGLPVLLVLAGENDTSEPTERFARAVPQAAIRTLEAGHDVIQDAPQETAGLVADFLAAVI